MKHRQLSSAVITGITALLTGCGGGSSGSGNSGVEATPPTTSIAIAGVAAKGAALPGAAVSAKCATGSGSATTDAGGHYTLTITSGALPCALRAVSSDGATTFHSLLAGTGTSGSFTAHVTPLTELIVAHAAAALPSEFFATFSGAGAPSTAAVTQAIEAVRTMAGGLVDLFGINPIRDPLVASSGSGAGNALDQKIDALMAGLSRGKVSLTDVTRAVATNPMASSVIQTALRPVSEDCPWLRTGPYREVTLGGSWIESFWGLAGTGAWIDATRREIASRSSDFYPFPLTRDGDCRYMAEPGDGTSLRITASASGILVVVSSEPAAPAWVTLWIPEQTLPLTEFAGTWHLAGWDPASGSATPGYVAQTGEATFDDQGRITALADCLGVNACSAANGPFPTLAPHSRFGFTVSEGGVAIGGVMLFKTLSGHKVFMLVTADGQFVVGTPKAALGAPPAAGTVSNYREFQLNGDGTVGPLIDQTVTLITVDAANKTATRRRTSDGRVDTLHYDQPRAGLRYRAPSSCTTNGVPSPCAETVQLPLQGMGITLGLSVGTTPANAFFGVSVTKPGN